MVSWSGVEIHGAVSERLWRSLSNMTRGSLLVLSLVLMIRLVLGGQIETHAEILVVPKRSLLCDIVEDDNWSCHFDLFLLLEFLKL